MPQQTWSHEETLAAFNLYCRTPFGRLHARNPDIIALAEALGRTPSALAMKCCNLASLDPVHQARGVKGLRKASKGDRRCWEAFHSSPEAVGFESELAVADILRQDPRVSDTVEWEDIAGLDRSAMTKVRVNQHLFRAMIIAGYGGQCAVCGMSLACLLVASHIVPWAIDASLRMNPRNGICLCALHDRAFDRGLLLIDPQYQISLHQTVHEHAANPAVQDSLVRHAGSGMRLPERWHPEPELLARHGRLFSPA